MKANGYFQRIEKYYNDFSFTRNIQFSFWRALARVWNLKKLHLRNIPKSRAYDSRMDKAIP